MATKYDLETWLTEALKALGGSGRIASICKHVWEAHEAELRDSGELFYTWQYDIRWAAQRLSQQGVMKSKRLSPRGVWELRKPIKA